MRAAPPDIASLRPKTSVIPENTFNTSSVPVSNMHQPISPLGPPNVQQQIRGSIAPNSSQPQISQGARPGGHSFGSLGPPNNTTLHQPVVNGQ